ncbi:hypothetical protein [Streptomyces megasporus]|uniref:hypothetical protein n=1 Tax=Streptomyces megasporus TaxID=44060 RepID=UPI00068C1CAA|nr:hypothetical protein [Streptomyces megasporus]
MTEEMILAGALEEMGDHLLDVGQGWTDKGLALILAALVVVQIGRKFSVKAGIGAAIGMVLCLGIYDSRQDLRDDVKDEITTVESVRLERIPVDRVVTGIPSTGPIGVEGGGVA